MNETKIMIVEDEAITAMDTKSKLNNMGYEVCKLVATGEDAIKYTEHNNPDIVLMDIILKGVMSGIEAAGEIHSRFNIPIIFTTGCEDEGTRELAEDVKPVAYLIKPIELEDLRLAIGKALHKHK